VTYLEVKEGTRGLSFVRIGGDVVVDFAMIALLECGSVSEP
jgi:hypothetical protein